MIEEGSPINLHQAGLSSQHGYADVRMADIIQVLSLVIGAGPALGLMYFTLKDYTFPAVEKPFFNDKKVFLFFAIGIIVGVIVFGFEDWGTRSATPETAIGLILGFAIMEELMKFVVLNFPRFQRKVDTAFCGVGFGLGIAATFSFATVYVFFLDVGNVQIAEVVAGSLLGFMFVLLHGSTTGLIGTGIARGEAQMYFIEALLIHIGFAFFYQSFFAVDIVPFPVNLAGLVVAAAIVVWAYHRLHSIALPNLISDAKRLYAQGKMKA